MSEPYVVGGRTFTPGELCLVRAHDLEWLPGVIAERPPYDKLSMWVHVKNRYGRWVFYTSEVLLLSENFAPGLPPDLPVA